jgi:mevalonate kinase
MKTIVSAPGKIHLMGEHAVVHGAPALLAAVNRRLVATVEDADSLKIETEADDMLVREAIRVVGERLNIQDPPVKVTICSAIPAGRHLGSSAAVSVATVGALLYHLKKIWNPTLINKLAYEVEKKQHGTPSGGDNSVCTFGGFVWFRKELEDLKTIWQLPYTIHPSLAPFHLVDTGSPTEHTGEMVGFVHAWVQENPIKAREAFFQNEQATKQITTSLKSGDESQVIAAIRSGSKTLEQMGVVSKQVMPVIRAIEESGGAAKILGGGGKTGPVGLLLAYHRDRKKLVAVANKFKYPLHDVELGEEGVRLESGRIAT